MRNVAREHERHSSYLLSIPVNPMTPKQKVPLGAIHTDNLAQKYRFESYSMAQSLTAHKDFFHCSDVIMGAMASQITSLTIVYSTVYSDAGQRKHQSSASLAFVPLFKSSQDRIPGEVSEGATAEESQNDSDLSKLDYSTSLSVTLIANTYLVLLKSVVEVDLFLTSFLNTFSESPFRE